VGTYNWRGDCACANGFPVLAEGLYVVIIQTTATNGILSFFLGGGGRWWRVLEEFVWVCVWGLYPESLSRREETDGG
jgi:hypothetical protein